MVAAPARPRREVRDSVCPCKDLSMSPIAKCKDNEQGSFFSTCKRDAEVRADARLREPRLAELLGRIAARALDRGDEIAIARGDRIDQRCGAVFGGESGFEHRAALGVERRHAIEIARMRCRE